MRGGGGGGGGGGRDPPENHKKIGFLSNTGPDPLKNHKATKPAFMMGHHWPAREVHLSPHQLKKRYQSWIPYDKSFWIPACEQNHNYHILLHVLLKTVTKCLVARADTACDSKPITAG